MSVPQAAPMAPSQVQGETAEQYLARWQAYADKVTQAWAAAAGWEKDKLAAQRDDAQKGLQNAMAIAKLQSETSRYGTDVGRQNLLDQLKEQARQYDATHALDMQRLGLDYAKTATDYLSTPDRFAQSIDFVSMANRALGRGVANGGQGPSPYGQGVAFQPKTEDDFAVLAGYAQPGASGSGTSTSNGVAHVLGAGEAARTSTGADPRVAAVTSMIKSLPPSETEGLDPADYAVLRAARELYSTNLRAGTIERMRPDQRGIYQSAVQRSGRSWNDYLTDYKRQGIGQGSVRAIN